MLNMVDLVVKSSIIKDNNSKFVLLWEYHQIREF